MSATCAGWLVCRRGHCNRSSWSSVACPRTGTWPCVDCAPSMPRCAADEGDTVASICARFGVRDFGRFLSRYRRHFGVLPSHVIGRGQRVRLSLQIAVIFCGSGELNQPGVMTAMPGIAMSNARCTSQRVATAMISAEPMRTTPTW